MTQKPQIFFILSLVITPSVYSMNQYTYEHSDQRNGQAPSKFFHTTPGNPPTAYRDIESDTPDETDEECDIDELVPLFKQQREDHEKRSNPAYARSKKVPDLKRHDTPTPEQQNRDQARRQKADKKYHSYTYRLENHTPPTQAAAQWCYCIAMLTRTREILPRTASLYPGRTGKNLYRRVTIGLEETFPKQ